MDRSIEIAANGTVKMKKSVTAECQSGNIFCTCSLRDRI